MTTIYTIGHSNHPIEKFLALLRGNGITALVDVRSRPYSRRHPQYNRDALAISLSAHSMSYVPAGDELGGRSGLSYAELASTPQFASGLERVLGGARSHRVAVMCAEKEPLDCHRTLLVTRALERRGAEVLHILADGGLEPNVVTMQRLIRLVGLEENDLFKDQAELIDEACRRREARRRPA